MTTTQAIARSIARIGGATAFVSHRSAPANDLRLEVDGVGRIRLPVSAAAARKLCAIAKPARHGYKDETRLDRRVRDTWEIARRRLSIDTDAWNRTLSAQLEHIRRDLGLPQGFRLRAQLHNLLVYEPGQFFASHQDSEKTDNMIATLVVGLPSTFKGGAMVIEQHGEKVVVRGSASKLSFVAFYADCHHEVRPVTYGCRIALTYNLSIEGGARAAVGGSANELQDVQECVQRYFASPLPPRWSGDRAGSAPDRLVYLLDYEYTQRGLAWSRLKGVDAARAAALREVATRLECEIYLALADVHETWSCEPEFHGAAYRWNDYYDEEEFEDAGDEPETDFALTDLIESEAELRHFVGANGRPDAIASAFDMRELCCTKPSVEFDPFESEHEGYMGNYGNTVDRWYHRAAVVLWPREREFVIRAKASPRWAIDTVIKTMKAEGTAAALAQAQRLLPFWTTSPALAEDNRLFERTVALAAVLDEAATSAGLLQPFTLLQLSAKVVPGLLDCLRRYGLEWCNELLEQWTPVAYQPPEQRLTWIAAKFPALCQALHAARETAGSTFACRLLAQEWNWMQEHWRQLRTITSPRVRTQTYARLCEPLRALVEVSVRLQQLSVHAQIFAALTAVDDGPMATLAVGLLRSAYADRKSLPDLRLQSLHAYWLDRLSERLQRPLRAPDDWSITQPLHCDCKLCTDLRRFLTAPDEVRYEWPLAEAKRKHIHQKIDSHELPVSHVTRRRGSPYTLVLEKTQDLFKRDAAARRTTKANVAWLTGKAARF